MSDELREARETIDRRLAKLQQEEAAIQARLTEIRDEKADLKAAFDRSELFVTDQRKRAIDDCVWCFVFHDYETKMTPLDSDKGGVDIFRCRQCKRTVKIKVWNNV